MALGDEDGGSILATRSRLASQSRVLRAIAAMLLAGCGTAPSAPATAEPGGFVTVTIARAPGAEPGFLAPVHRARLIGVDGSVAAAWQVMEPATPVQLEPGVYRLEFFTIFLSDVYVCEIDPAAPGGSRCGQPTMGPAQVCNVDVEVVAGQQTHATFLVLREGLCGLESAQAPGTT
jgi:hypothetical protein